MLRFSGNIMGRLFSFLRTTGSIPSPVINKMPWQTLPSSARDSSAEAVLTAFASMPMEMALQHLQTNSHGLAESEVNERRRISGVNVLPSQKSPSWIITLLKAIPTPFNLLLLFIAVLEISVPEEKEWPGFVIMILMVVISVILRFWQEQRSSLAVFRLQSSIVASIKARRKLPATCEYAGKVDEAVVTTIPGQELVPGDVILLSPGSVIPADCLVLEASFLRISQSTWTGENEPVPKCSGPPADKNTPLLDLQNISLMGTSVVSGNAVALVLRTGGDAFIAGMANELEKRREQNAFQKGIRNVSFMWIGFMCVMVPIVLGISGKTTGDWEEAALFAMSVAVGLIPEMLPAIVNANLARGAYILSKTKAILKRLDSVQNLGAMSILCSDKTGTLTRDEITLSEYLDPTGANDSFVLKLATIEANNQSEHGNNIDAAIVNYHLANHRVPMTDDYSIVASIPFTFERRRSASIIKDKEGNTMLITKGASDEVMALCSLVRQGEVIVPFDVETKRRLLERVDGLNKNGYRVLLVAAKELPANAITTITGENAIGNMDDNDLRGLEPGMTLHGLLSFADPPKSDAAESISQLKELGVEIKILTGDSLSVTLNTCQALGMVGNGDMDDDLQAITGPELAQIGEGDTFDDIVRKCVVFAKLTPKQKALVVDSLRRAGHCVGMLGDGINDCMALRKADVGITVDTAVSMAKDFADIILLNKELSLVVSSVRAGRITHGNTIKYIKMVASSNFGNVFSVLASSAWLPYQPMLGLQILTQNLLYDISQIAIPWDNVDPEYLESPKRWDTLDLLRFILVLGPTSSVIDVMTYLLGWYYYGVQTADDVEAVGMVQAHWYLQSILTQTLVVHILRTAKIPFLQSRASMPLAISTSIIMAIGFAVPWIPPLQQFLSFSQPAGTYVGILAAQLILYCVEVQLVKVAYIRLFKTWL